MAPTPAMLADFTASCLDLKAAATHWRAVRSQGLGEFNAVLAKHGMTPATVTGDDLGVPACGGPVARHR